MSPSDIPGSEKLREIPLGNIPPGEKRQELIYLRGYRTPGDRIVKVKVRYHEILPSKESAEEECAVETENRLSFGKPFQIGANVVRLQTFSSLHSSHLDELSMAPSGDKEELFSLSISVKPSCGDQIRIQDVAFVAMVCDFFLLFFFSLEKRKRKGKGSEEILVPKTLNGLFYIAFGRKR